MQMKIIAFLSRSRLDTHIPKSLNYESDLSLYQSWVYHIGFLTYNYKSTTNFSDFKHKMKICVSKTYFYGLCKNYIKPVNIADIGA